MMEGLEEEIRKNQNLLTSEMYLKPWIETEGSELLVTNAAKHIGKEWLNLPTPQKLSITDSKFQLWNNQCQEKHNKKLFNLFLNRLKNKELPRYIPPVFIAKHPIEGKTLFAKEIIPKYTILDIYSGELMNLPLFLLVSELERAGVLLLDRYEHRHTKYPIIISTHNAGNLTQYVQNVSFENCNKMNCDLIIMKSRCHAYMVLVATQDIEPHEPLLSFQGTFSSSSLSVYDPKTYSNLCNFCSK